MAALIKRMGPQGEEFTRYSLGLHLIRNYYYTKTHYPKLLPTLVPGHIPRFLEKYDFMP
jgi:hypothetical protein